MRSQIQSSGRASSTCRPRLLVVKTFSKIEVYEVKEVLYTQSLSRILDFSIPDSIYI